MSKKKTSSGPAVPSTPKPQNSYFYENDQLRSQSVFDKGQNAYINKSFSTPEEQAIEKQATGYIGKLVNDLPGAVNLSPEAIGQYRDAFAAPQIAALNDSYNQAKGLATMTATGRGVRNSIGFSDYMANQVEKNRAQGLADIQANAKMMEYDLPNKLLMPYTNQFNLINAALNGQQANMAQDLQPSVQGSVNANNIANQNFANQMNAWQARSSQPKGGGGFEWRRLFTMGI